MEITKKLVDGTVAFEITDDDDTNELRADCDAAIEVLLDPNAACVPRIWRRAIANLLERLSP